jgi:hypothetical protein
MQSKSFSGQNLRGRLFKHQDLKELSFLNSFFFD